MLHKSTSIDVSALQREQVEDAQVRDENRSNYWKDKREAVNSAGRSCCHGVGFCCQQTKSCIVGIGDGCCNVVDLFLSCLRGIGSGCYHGLDVFNGHILTIYELYEKNFWGIHAWLWTLGAALIIATYFYEDKVPMVLSIMYLVPGLVDQAFLIAYCLAIFFRGYQFGSNRSEDTCFDLFKAFVIITFKTVAGFVLCVAFNIVQLRVGYNFAKYHGNFDILNYKTTDSIESAFGAVSPLLVIYLLLLCYIKRI